MFKTLCFVGRNLCRAIDNVPRPAPTRRVVTVFKRLSGRHNHSKTFVFVFLGVLDFVPSKNLSNLPSSSWSSGLSPPRREVTADTPVVPDTGPLESLVGQVGEGKNYNHLTPCLLDISRGPFNYRIVPVSRLTHRDVTRSPYTPRDLYPYNQGQRRYVTNSLKVRGSVDLLPPGGGVGVDFPATRSSVSPRGRVRSHSL